MPASTGRTPPGAAPARAGTPPLTAREREVLALLVRGRSNREMARALHFSVPTVKAHVQHVLTKLGARNRIEAIGLAHAAGAAGRRPGVERDPSAVQAGVATMRAGGRAPVSVPEGQAAGTTVRDAVQP